MKIFIDTNVIIDVLLKRENFYKSSRNVLVLCEKKLAKGFISAASVTDIFYIVNKQLHDKEKTIQEISKILSFLNVVKIDGHLINSAIKSGWNDFEDSIQFYAACSKKVNFIITRNEKHFINSKIKVINPDDFISILI